MNRSVLAPLGLSLGLLALTPAAAEACSCPPSGPPCQEVWESPLVFVGTVIDVDQPPESYSPRRVRLRITEAFRGSEEGEIELHLRGSGSASCDPPFKMGEAWLVYADNQWEGGPGWTTSTCSRTRLLSAAAEDLGYLRLPDSQKTPSQIIGRVTRSVYDSSGETHARTEGVADVSVAATRGSERVETKTDPDGRYAIDATQGAYLLEFGPADGVELRGPELVHLRHPRACTVANAHVPFRAGRVAGQVVDHRGLPVAFLPVMMASLPRRMSPQRTMTDAAGRFSFDARFPGPYIVVPGAEGWPAAAAAAQTPLVMVPSGAEVDAGQLRLPASLALVLVEFVIENGVGRPAGGAEFSFRHPDIFSAGSYEPHVRADERGRFLVTLAAGMIYEITASQDRKTPDGTAYEELITSITAGSSRVRLRLGPSKRFLQ